MNARDIVTARIAEQARRFPDWLNLPLETSALESRDAALAAAIDHAVMRRWLTLVAIIESRLARPWAEIEFKLQAALLVGAAQLLLLERVPDHAAINEAVEWAKRHVRPKAGGMVNAVLRKVAALRGEVVNAKPQGSGVASIDLAVPAYARDEMPRSDGGVWKFAEPVFGEEPARRLAQQTSHAEPLINHWVTALGPEAAARIAQHDLVQSPILVHGDFKPNQATLLPHEEPGFFVFDGGRDMLGVFLRENPNAIVQDPTAAAVANATKEFQSLNTIIDACAGMGTKTRQLAALHPRAKIIATDIAEPRTEMLRRQFAGHDRVEVIDHRELTEYVGAADLLLLDVPCSNTGVLARRVEAKYRYSKQSQDTIVDLQRQIIADSLTLLSGGGRLLYSTCSIESAENEQQAQWICKWHRLRIAAQRLQYPQGLPGDPPNVYRDGGYYALLERIGHP